MKGLSDEKAIEEAADKSGPLNSDVATHFRNVRAADPKKGEEKKQSPQSKSKDKKAKKERKRCKKERSEQRGKEAIKEEENRKQQTEIRIAG